jgi:hypothetical protein
LSKASLSVGDVEFRFLPAAQSELNDSTVNLSPSSLEAQYNLVLPFKVNRFATTAPILQQPLPKNPIYKFPRVANIEPGFFERLIMCQCGVVGHDTHDASGEAKPMLDVNVSSLLAPISGDENQHPDITMTQHDASSAALSGSPKAFRLSTGNFVTSNMSNTISSWSTTSSSLDIGDAVANDMPTTSAPGTTQSLRLGMGNALAGKAPSAVSVGSPQNLRPGSGSDKIASQGSKQGSKQAIALESSSAASSNSYSRNAQSSTSRGVPTREVDEQSKFGPGSRLKLNLSAVQPVEVL